MRLSIAAIGVITCLVLSACNSRSGIADQASWKREAVTLTFSSRVESDGSYLVDGPNPAIESVFRDLIGCGFQRYEVNYMDHMHGGYLQIIVPDDGLLDLARPCLNKKFSDSINYEKYNINEDVLGQRIIREAKEVTDAVSKYRERKNLRSDNALDADLANVAE